jgi:hypothetical protein
VASDASAARLRPAPYDAHRSDMPRNDRSDSLSVRSPDDPRTPLRRMQEEVERELRDHEAEQTGGPAHRSAREREETDEPRDREEE